MFRKLTLVGILSLFTFVNSVLAHDAIYSLKKFVGERIIIVNYNVDHPHAGVPIQFNIRLYTLSEGIPIEYQKLKFDLKRGPNLVYSKELESKNINETDTTYTFSQPGDYQLEVKFLKDSGVIAEAIFPLPVDKKINTGLFNLWSIESGAGFVVGLVVGLIAFGNRASQIKKRLLKLPFLRYPKVVH